MFRKVLLTIGLLLAAQVAIFAQGTIKGTVSDAEKGEVVPYAKVKVMQDGQLVQGAQTDFDGLFTIKAVPVGKYDIEVSASGFKTYKRTGVDVKASGFTVVNVQLNSASTVIEEIVIEQDRVKLIDIGDASSGQTMSADDIKKLPATSVDAIVATMAGVGYNDGGTSTARGEDGMVTMQGNVRKRTGIQVPKEAIASIQVILGGTPASVGEAIGGAQIITLIPPSNQFTGMVKYETYTNYSYYNLLTTYLTGPVIKTKKDNGSGGVTESTLLGFRFTGQFSYTPWGYYRAKGHELQVVNDNKVRELEENPLVYDPVEGAVNYAGEYLRANDFVSIKYPTAKNYFASADRAPNFRSYSAAGQLNLVLRLGDNATLDLTGEFTYGKDALASVDPLNLTRGANGVGESNSYAITLDFTQQFPDAEPSATGTEAESQNAKAISNVMWNFSMMYNRAHGLSYNESYGKSINDVMAYGHVGQFFTTQERSYQSGIWNDNGVERNAQIQNAWYEVTDLDKFQPSNYNPILANYTEQLMRIDDLRPYLINFDYIQQFRGIINGGNPSSIYGIYNNVGVQSGSYAISEDNYFYGQIKAAATLFGKHDIELGFQYDQASNSRYSLNAHSLWTIMRNAANSHISQLDFSNPITHEEDGVLYVDFDRLVGGGQTVFDASLREALGAADNEWLDVDRYMPDWYVDAAKNLGLNNVLGMFSSNDLFNSYNTLVSYYGFDHTGAKYNARGWDLDDFFDPLSKGHPNYNYRPAFTPIYMAGYIQDKFYFEDLIFNVGVRVDYYDANQYVLKDPYLLYESYTVGQLQGSDISYNTGLANNAFANAAQPDWVVYVDDASAPTPTIRGYRSGSVWYDANGVEVSTPSAIAGESGKPTPFRTAEGQTTATLGNGSGNKVSSKAFEAYKQRVVVMPRLAFSFPVGELAQFKASYDIIARRPSSGWQADYFSYLYMNQVSAINNPNLSPERITNYELGFQQALGKKAAVGIIAYYKETRDLIQLVQYAGADPNQNYYSYDNIDFKTTKGFTFTFDLRSTNRIRINANYTLQYAEGTGLSTTTMSELIKEGYTSLKMLNPISDDRRHEAKVNLDYRFKDKDGWSYNTTKKNKETGEAERVSRYPFQNFGVNVTGVVQSGRPYTRAYSNMQHTIVGSVNGARLPWCFFVDAQVDKTWTIKVNKRKGGFRMTYLNAAAIIRNVFDIRNVAGVYAVTGSPTDNGYLTDPETQTIINSYLDSQSFRDMYGISLNSAWNYTSPRTIRLVLTYSF